MSHLVGCRASSWVSGVLGLTGCERDAASETPAARRLAHQERTHQTKRRVGQGAGSTLYPPLLYLGIERIIGRVPVGFSTPCPV